MKLVIKTKRHFGDNNIHLQGVQFEAYFIHSPTDTEEEFKAMHELSNIVKSDCKEAGWYYGFGRYADHESTNGTHSGGGRTTPLTPTERVLKARAASAENLARDYKRQMDAMRLVLVRNGLGADVTELLKEKTQ